MDRRFGWFGTWVEQHLLVTLTVASTPDAGRLLSAFGPTAFDRGSLSLAEAYDIDEPTVRLGTSQGWTYAVEHASTTGADPDFLRHLTVDGSLAVALCFTATISTVHVARDGEHVTGFEPSFPDDPRWGTTPHAFDVEIEAAGFRQVGYQPPGGPAASFLDLVTGVTLVPAMLEDPLPCGSLPGPRRPASGSPSATAPLIPGTLLPGPAQGTAPTDGT